MIKLIHANCRQCCICHIWLSKLGDMRQTGNVRQETWYRRCETEDMRQSGEVRPKKIITHRTDSNLRSSYTKYTHPTSSSLLCSTLHLALPAFLYRAMCLLSRQKCLLFFHVFEEIFLESYFPHLINIWYSLESLKSLKFKIFLFC